MGQHSFGSDVFGKRPADGTFGIFIAQHWILIFDASMWNTSKSSASCIPFTRY